MIAMYSMYVSVVNYIFPWDIAFITIINKKITKETTPTFYIKYQSLYYLLYPNYAINTSLFT